MPRKIQGGRIVRPAPEAHHTDAVVPSPIRLCLRPAGRRAPLCAAGPLLYAFRRVMMLAGFHRIRIASRVGQVPGVEAPAWRHLRKVEPRQSAIPITEQMLARAPSGRGSAPPRTGLP